MVVPLIYPNLEFKLWLQDGLKLDLFVLSGLEPRAHLGQWQEEANLAA